MSNKILERGPCSRSPHPRSKSPIYLSPKNKFKQNISQPVHIPSTNSHGHHQQQGSEYSGGEGIFKNLQPHLLQFSASRKLKSKHPGPVAGLSAFINANSSPYGFTPSGLANENTNLKPSNQNRNTDVGRMEGLQAHKIRLYYESQIRNLVEGHKNVQAELENKIKGIEKEKIYWKDCFTTIRQQYDDLAKLGQAGKQDPHKNEQSGVDYQVLGLQERVQKCQKSLKIAQNQIYILNKQKADLSYELTFYREESRKASAQVFQLQYEVEVHKKEIKELQQKIKKQQENGLVRSMDLKAMRSSQLTMSLEHPSQFNCQPESPKRSGSSSKSRSSSSSSLSLSSSGGKHRSSRHHRSSSHNHSIHHRQPHPQIAPLNINYDFTKQIERFRHSCRKLEKSLVNQNSQIMTAGLRKLNSKYERMYEEEEAKIIPFKFPTMNLELKGKITSIKYI